jgi:hypothetical protein
VSHLYQGCHLLNPTLSLHHQKILFREELRWIVHKVLWGDLITKQMLQGEGKLMFIQSLQEWNPANQFLLTLSLCLMVQLCQGEGVSLYRAIEMDMRTGDMNRTGMLHIMPILLRQKRRVLHITVTVNLATAKGSTGRPTWASPFSPGIHLNVQAFATR